MCIRDRMGAGRTETARALFGADPKESGDIYINGEKVDIKNPMDAVKCGIGYLSEDRKRYGIVVGKSVAENTTCLLYTSGTESVCCLCCRFDCAGIDIITAACQKYYISDSASSRLYEKSTDGRISYHRS